VLVKNGKGGGVGENNIFWLVFQGGFKKYVKVVVLSNIST
jgi:hypothetical protein